MRTLLVLRHAKSSWKGAGLADHDRPLNKRGRHDAPRMGSLVKRLGLVPDRIVSSTAVRAWATAQEVANHAGYTGEILSDRLLYLAGPSTLVEVVRAAGADAGERVMLVGHNPGSQELVWRLTGKDEDFPTAALAQIELPIDDWTDLRLSPRGRLAGLWRPKELPDDDPR